MKNQSEWPAASVKMRSLEGLLPYAKNARTHSPEQINEIAASMQEWGWTNPVLIDEEGMIIAGHGRVLAAQQLGIVKAPVMTARGWTERQKSAYVLADNKLALNAGWDLKLLGVELQDLQGAGFDLALAGFSASELSKLSAGGPGLTDPDEVPPTPAIAATQAGDVWLLGAHRLVCGDSTDKAAVEACLAGQGPHLMVTDPPYGVSYDPAWRERYDQFKRHAIGKVRNDDRSSWTDVFAASPVDVIYCWSPPGSNQMTFFASLTEAGFEVRQQIVWVKQHFVFGRGHYHYRHEPCWYAVRKGATAHWQGDRKQDTVWEIVNHNPMGGKADDATTGHGTQKPVECMRRPIENNSKAGDRVYDPFLGSGTTIIAAEMTGRICHAIELDPLYCEVAVKRWEDFTGKKAVLEHERPQAEAHASEARHRESRPAPATEERATA